MKIHRPGQMTLCLVTFTLLCGLTSAYAADRDPTDDFVTLATAGAAYLNDTSRCPGIIDASVVLTNPDDFTVIDIRSSSRCWSAGDSGYRRVSTSSSCS